MRDNVEYALKVGLACGIITAIYLLGVVTPEVSRVESAAIVLEVDLRPGDVEKSGSLEKCLELIGGLSNINLKIFIFGIPASYLSHVPSHHISMVTDKDSELKFVQQGIGITPTMLTCTC